MRGRRELSFKDLKDESLHGLITKDIGGRLDR
jgi:hypothetical protein